MELRLQEFIASVETLADIRNLDQWNPIVFQLEHPITATRYTIVGSKQEPSYLGIPVNTTWVVLDPESPYYRMALKLVDTDNPDRSTNITPINIDMNSSGSVDEGDLVLFWNIVRTYDEIFETPQYYVTGGRGPKGDKGDPGEPGAVDYSRAIATLASLTGTLRIDGPTFLDENSTQQYTVTLIESQILPDGTVTDPEPRVVVTPISLAGNVPEGMYMDPNNVLHVGSVTANTPLRLYAEFPSWAKNTVAHLDVTVRDVAAQVTGVTMSGPDSVVSGNTAQYTINVAWSDGTTSVASGEWRLDSANFGSITNTGLLNVPSSIAASGSVNVSANVTINGVLYTPNKTVVVTKQVAPATVTSVSLSGLGAVNSNTQTQYTFVVNWSDGTTTNPPAAWSLNSSAFGSISSNGLFTVPDGISSSGSVTVTGSVVVNGVTHTATKTVAVTKVVVPPTVTGVSLTGSQAVNNGQTAQYVVVVNWSNGTTTNPSAASWSLDSANFGSISSSGLLTVPSDIANSGSVIVTANVTVNGVEYNPTRTVTVTKVDLSALTPRWGNGPALPSNWSSFINGLTAAPSKTVDGKYQVSFDNTGSSNYMYFAYPSAHGEATFYDKLSQFFGGWGGAGNTGQGPSAATMANYRDMPTTQTININGTDVSFYIYRADFPNLGTAAMNRWEVTLTTP